jgi:DNA-binding MarR family transcriptional regulator
VKELAEPDDTRQVDEFRLEEFLPYRLAVASEMISRLIFRHHFARLGLGMPEWRLIAAIGQHGVLSPTTAGERTAMDKVKVSRAAATLVARGVLRQSPDPNDGRGRLLRLTRKGTTIYANFAPIAADVEASLAQSITRTEWNTLQKALGKLIDHGSSVLGNSADEEE